MILSVTVLGRPAPQGSKRGGTAAGTMIEQSAYLPAWRRAVKVAAYRAYATVGILPDALPLFDRVPVYVHELTFILGDEQARADGTDEPIGPPDVDKLTRATLDGLTDARVYRDDAQVVDFRIGPRKVRARPDLPAGAILKISSQRWEES